MRANILFFFNTLDLNLKSGLPPAEAITKTVESYAAVFLDLHEQAEQVAICDHEADKTLVNGVWICLRCRYPIETLGVCEHGFSDWCPRGCYKTSR